MATMADTTGYIGLGGTQNVFATPAQGASVLPSAGSILDFTGYGFGPTGNVTLTLVKNGAPTTLSCTLSANASTSSCTAAGSESFSAGDSITVRIQNTSGSLVRNVGFTLTYSTS